MKTAGLLVIACLILGAGAIGEAGSGLLIRSIQPYGEDEVAEIVNRAGQMVDLTGWRLESSNSLGQEVKETFWFPRGCLLPQGAILRVHSGPYARGWGDRSCGYRQIDLPWMGIAVWNDTADVAWLRDPSGELIDLYTYTAEAERVSRPFPQLKPRPQEPYCCWETEPRPGRCCRPCPSPDRRCCAVKVALISIEPVCNECVAENWRFFAIAGPLDQPVFPGNLPQVIYEDRFGDELLLELGGRAVEQDRRPARGQAARTIRLCCPLRCQTERTITIDVKAEEDQWCYAGCGATWRFHFEVLVEPAYIAAQKERALPNADFIASPAGRRHVGDLVTLDGSPATGEELLFEWDFDGDGRPDATGGSVSHRLAREGMNLITLTVTDRWGQSDSITRGVRALPDLEGTESELGLFWLTLPALAVGYFLVLAFGD